MGYRVSHELAHAAAILVIGTERMMRKVPMVYKALAVIVIVFAAGTVLGSAWTEQRAVPSKVVAFENRLSDTEAAIAARQRLVDSRLAERERYVDGRIAEQDRQLNDIYRQGELLLCRLDGNTANYCDLQYNRRRAAP